MKPRKPEKTLADYLAIAIGPLLIMAMIGSLTFFLLEVSYEGEHTSRLRWTLFWFVLASVLISRISIEQGSSSAGIYGLGLAVATGLMISRFVNFAPGVWCSLAFIWWCASKLTWDCTLIDDDEDASGEGLLQAARLEADFSERGESENSGARSGKSLPFWRQVFKNRSGRAGQPHAPGLWVLYFSLIALPLFGVGQLLIPARDVSSRRFGFVLLLVYAAAALGLLLSTSFLGLRRYLRQRRLQMTPDMARTWIGFGATLAGAILIASLLLPRPEAAYSLTALIGKIGSPESAASESSLFRRASETGDESQMEDSTVDGGQRGRSGQGKETGDGRGSAPNGSRPPNRTSTPQSGWASLALLLAFVLKWIFYALLACLLIYGLVRNRDSIADALSRMAQEFLAFWNRLFGRKNTAPPAGGSFAAATTPVGPPPFSRFTDPFATGQAGRMTLPDLICYSFEALQACARECGVPRRPEQTPLEFGSMLSRSIPELQMDAPLMTRIYAKLAYSGQPPTEDNLASLERLWRGMAAATRQMG